MFQITTFKKCHDNGLLRASNQVTIIILVIVNLNDQTVAHIKMSQVNWIIAGTVQFMPASFAEKCCKSQVFPR